MTQIGFTAASVGVMAAAYAAVVPLLEVPSGIVADRWSRTWVMVLATVALMASTLLGGLSTNVTTYVLAAMLLGVYFALSSGTVDSMVYDAVMEETGSSERYETWIGRVRIAESGALVASAIAGGVLASWTSPRFTYFASIPLIALAVLAFRWFEEPRLHRSAEPVALRTHIALMFRTMTRQRNVVRIVLLSAVAALVSQAIFEFGPLWLVALSAPAVLFGPYWAALVSTIGLGGYLTGKLNLSHRVLVVGLAVIGPAATITLAVTRSLVAVVIAQTALALLLAIIGIHAGRLLHDSVPSTIRAGVSSGVGTLSWVLFLPFALALGALASRNSVPWSGWILTGAAMAVSILFLVSSLGRAAVAVPAQAGDAGAAPPPAADIACQEAVEMITDYMEGALTPGRRAELEDHLAGCDGCTEYMDQMRTTVGALQTLSVGESLQDRGERLSG